MLNSVKVEGFRGIKSGGISSLGQINILTGKNNNGKSAFLQSLFFLNETSGKEGVIPYLGQKALFWSYQKENPIKYNVESNGKKFDILYKESMNKRICVDITNSLKDKRGFYERVGKDPNFKYINRDFNITFSENRGGVSTNIKPFCTDDIIDFFETINSSILLSHHNFLKSSEQLSTLLDKLQNALHEEDNFLRILSETYEKRLRQLRHSPHEFEGWSIFLSDGNESRTISFDDLGDGARTCINILLQLFVQKPKIVLIDEIELHQHRKSLDYLCKTVVRWVKKNNSQLFASTHNLDAIKILSELANENKMSAFIHHCMLNEGILKARTIPSLDAKTVIDLTGDIRYIDEYV